MDGSKHKTPLSERVEQFRVLCASNREITAEDLENQTGLSRPHISRILKLAGITLNRERRRYDLWEEDKDVAFAIRAFGDDFIDGCDVDDLTGDCDQEYMQVCQELGFVGFRYVGEVWLRYRNLWAHKRQGLTLANGIFRETCEVEEDLRRSQYGISEGKKDAGRNAGTHSRRDSNAQRPANT